jgi:hypothetical protein
VQLKASKTKTKTWSLTPFVWKIFEFVCCLWNGQMGWVCCCMHGLESACMASHLEHSQLPELERRAKLWMQDTKGWHADAPTGKQHVAIKEPRLDSRKATESTADAL